MQQELELLKKLQELDSKLQELESLKGDLPIQVSNLKQQFKDKEQLLADKKEELISYQKETDSTEVEIKGFEDKKKKYQSQLYEVKTNREYDAVTHEIENVKTEIGTRESRILELMDLEEESKQTLKEEQSSLEILKNQFKEKNTELEKKIAKTEKQTTAFQKEREKLLPKVNKKYLASYERIRKAKNGIAVVPIIRNACGGCSRTLPPQRILEIRKMNRFFLCEVCGRILVWDEDKAGSK